MRLSALVYTLFLLVGCSNAGGTISADGSGTVADGVTQEVHAGLDARQPLDSQDLSMVPELLDQWVFELTEETVGPCAAGEGCFLDECQSNDDCLSGWCVEHLGAGVCTQTCQDECPPGWSCNQVNTGGADLVFVCVSQFANLCRPCSDSGDCTSTGGSEDACVDYGAGGSFCGGPCALDSDCPWGFSCAEAQTVDGVSLFQCVVDAGECPCTEKSVGLGLATPCEVSNEWGKCQGQRVCTESGLSACDAAVAMAETCNGLDDDCDGDVDEPDLVEGNFVNLCDDGNQCTKDICAGAEGCVNEVLEQGDCSDSDACTVADHCEAGKCVGEPVICDDKNPCTDNVCTVNGGCDFPPVGGDCDDEDPCTLGDHCTDGVCQGEAVACDCQDNSDCGALEDGDLCNGTLYCDTGAVPYICRVDAASVVSCPAPEGLNAPCLAAACDGETGACSLLPANAGGACDDGDPCTAKDSCVDGACVGAGATNCNDGNPCTDDSCDATDGCLQTPNDASCSDGDVCTTSDQCAGGACVGGPALVCDDGNACNGVESCQFAVGCVAGQTLSCDDENPCNGLEKCDAELGCVPGAALVCDDGNPCTDDSCDANLGCVSVANQAPCDDGNACTLSDVCSAGVCKAGPTLDCNDDDVCTTDSCDAAQGCLHLLNTAPCDDGDLCTTGDHCQLGECAGSGQLTCNDGNACTDDACEPDVGCTFTPNAAPCDDGNACTTDDACSAGWCKGGGALKCDDENSCTNDACDSETGCIHFQHEGECDDGSACTIGDQCQNGACVSGPTLVCDDNNVCTDDACDPGQGCVYTGNDLMCDDSNACTDGDVCAEGECVPGPVLDCDDLEVCTDDACLPESGCANTPVADGTGCGENFECWAGECVDACESGNIQFGYSGAAKEWVVPKCVTTITVEVWGAQGGTHGFSPYTPGGAGGYAKGELSVTPGETLYIYVGGSGKTGGGWNGGGKNQSSWALGWGGGASDVRQGGTSLNDRKIVGGGGGGNAAYAFGEGGWQGGVGGIGGGTSGQAGTASIGNNPPAGGGGGGSQNGAGSGGATGHTCCNYIPGGAGSFGQGGKGGGEPDNDACGSAGSGGGGWYGGGGGGHHNCGGGGGGGGSSYIGGVANGETTAGVRTGHGMVKITY